MSTDTGTAKSGGISALGLIGVLFVVLKVGGWTQVAEWSWLWVLAPFWAGLAIFVGIAAFIALFAGLVLFVAWIADLVEARNRRG